MTLDQIEGKRSSGLFPFSFPFGQDRGSMTVWLVLWLVGCGTSDRITFATRSELLFEQGQKAMQKELAGQAGDLTAALLPAGADGLYVNRALVDTAGKTCLLVALSQTMERETLDSLLRTDTRFQMKETLDFTSITDIHSAAWSLGDSAMRTFSFYEPGSGVLVHMVALSERFDETWFKRCVVLPEP